MATKVRTRHHRDFAHGLSSVEGNESLSILRFVNRGFGTGELGDTRGTARARRKGGWVRADVRDGRRERRLTVIVCLFSYVIR